MYSTLKISNSARKSLKFLSQSPIVKNHRFFVSTTQQILHINPTQCLATFVKNVIRFLVVVV